MIIKNFNNYFKLSINGSQYLFTFVLTDLSNIVDNDMNKKEYKKLVNRYLKYIKINYDNDVFDESKISIDDSILKDTKPEESLSIEVDKKTKSKLDEIILSGIKEEFKKYEKLTIEVKK